MVDSENKKDCENAINFHLEKAQKALDEAFNNQRICQMKYDLRALAFSGEILMSHVMNYVLRSNGIKAEAVEI